MDFILDDSMVNYFWYADQNRHEIIWSWDKEQLVDYKKRVDEERETPRFSFQETYSEPYVGFIEGLKGKYIVFISDDIAEVMLFKKENEIK